MKVSRKDGSEQDFVSEKIVVAVLKAGGRVDTARSIAREVESALARSSRVSTDQIRTEVLSRLMKADHATYDSWVAYEKQNKKR
jgi:transcriptional regulator NrdR family protein